MYYGIVGASLSEPHTSGTALQDACVWSVCSHIMYILNALKYFPKIKHPRAIRVGEGATARVQHQQPQRRPLKLKHAWHLTSCMSWQLRTDHQWQAARRPYKLYMPV